MPPGRVACLRTVSWTFVYLMVGLKLPIAALLYLVWWAVHQTPEVEGQGGDGNVRPRHPRPSRPSRRRPRGPHGGGDSGLAAPPRVRRTARLQVAARHRELTK